MTSITARAHFVTTITGAPRMTFHRCDVASGDENRIKKAKVADDDVDVALITFFTQMELIKMLLRRAILFSRRW